jgi:hypothetical protein
MLTTHINIHPSYHPKSVHLQLAIFIYSTMFVLQKESLNAEGIISNLGWIIKMIQCL